MTTITGTVGTTVPQFSCIEGVATQTDRRLAYLYGLPLQFGAETTLEGLLRRIVRQVVEIIPGASRGALLLKDRVTGRLLLKAHIPCGVPAVSLTCARQAMKQNEGLIWLRGSNVTRSQAGLETHSSLYAPLLLQGESLGVVCVDHSGAGSVFNNDDLRLLVAVAQYGAIAMDSHHAREDLRRQAKLIARVISRRFPPAVHAGVNPPAPLRNPSSPNRYLNVLLARGQENPHPRSKRRGTHLLQTTAGMALCIFRLEHPTMLLTSSNDYWAKSTLIPAIQQSSAASWARLFHLPVLSASNF